MAEEEVILGRTIRYVHRVLHSTAVHTSQKLGHSLTIHQQRYVSYCAQAVAEWSLGYWGVPLPRFRHVLGDDMAYALVEVCLRHLWPRLVALHLAARHPFPLFAFTKPGDTKVHEELVRKLSIVFT